MTGPDRQASLADHQTSPPRLSIVIVTWNSRDCIRECLHSLKAEAADAEVIVIDNNSGDGTDVIVEREFPWVRSIKNSRNLGYARANNQGIEASGGEYILLLNPDTVVKENAVSTLVRFAESRGKEVGGIAPQLLNSDLTVQPSCRAFPTLEILLWEFLGLSRLFPRSRTFGSWRMGDFDHGSLREVDQPMGSCLLVPARVFERVGYLDEQFPMFMNDVDLCYRIKNAGLPILFFPGACVVHHLGGSTRRVKPAMIASSHRSIYRYFRKHHPSVANVFLGAFLILAAMVRICVEYLKP